MKVMSSSTVTKEKFKSCFSIYHQALVDMIGKVFKGHVVYEQVDLAFDYAQKHNKGKVEFPYISVYASPNIEISALNNNYQAIKYGAPMVNEVPIYDDYGKETGVTNKVSKNVKNLYINIEYQIDVWAVDRQTVEEVTQELVFWLYENRELSINYYGQELIFTFTVGDNIVDNSDIINHETNNKLYRMSLNILVTGSIYRTENYFNVLKTSIDIDYLENNKEV